MLAEYGLIPDIFEPSSYSSAEVCDLRLRNLKDVLLQRGLVRDFCDGEWIAYFSRHEERWDRRAKELVRKLVDQKRLVKSPAALQHPPANEIAWCREALASNRSDPLAGIIAGNRTAETFEKESLVCSIERIHGAAWWNEDHEAVHLQRHTSEYLKHLSLILKSAN